MVGYKAEEEWEMCMPGVAAAGCCGLVPSTHRRTMAVQLTGGVVKDVG